MSKKHNKYAHLAKTSLPVAVATQAASAPTPSPVNPLLDFVPPPIPDIPGVTFKRRVEFGMTIDQGKGFRLEYLPKGKVAILPEDSTAIDGFQNIGHGMDHEDQKLYYSKFPEWDGKGPCYRHILNEDFDGVLDHVINVTEDDSDCKELTIFLRKRFEKMSHDRRHRLATSGKVRYSDLKYILHQGSEVIITGRPSFWDDEVTKVAPYGAVIQSIKMDTGWMGDTFLRIELIRFEQYGSAVQPMTHSMMINPFSGERDIETFFIRPIKDEEKAELSKAGEKWWNTVRKPTLVSYKGTMKNPGWWGSFIEREASGRVMIDGAGYQKFGQFDSTRRRWSELNKNEELMKYKNHMTPEVYWMASTTTFGFSMTLKEWGEFTLEGQEAPKYRKNAIRDLVLDEDKKTLILGLVQNNKLGFQDIVDGKGGGTIFLLHGEPGTGKTLTAEAVADFLEKPLYSVSVGELGTNPNDLETKLRNVLDITASWDAVLLLDEADIFLERRTSGPGAIERNAMVAIFLRLLEYHNGVLFLTTNRCEDFDEAFHSRISVIMEYGSLTDEKRAKIWENLLRAAGIEGIDTPTLAALSPINGRQIKNVIRSASILARSEGRAVTQRDIEKVIPLVTARVGRNASR